jgi:glycosyltransferase involved in cell wall biosynthesis
MRVAFVCIHYPPVLGGAETYVWNLATRMVRAGHEVDVHTSSSNAGQPIPQESLRPLELCDGVRVHRTRLYRGLQFFPRYNHSDIVHLNSFGPPYFFVESIRNLRRNLVSTPIGEEMIAWHKWRTRSLGGPFLRLSKRIVALSNLEREFLIHSCRLDPRRVTHIPLGVSDSAFEPPSVEHLEYVRSSITESEYFATVARVVASKNLGIGIRILSSLPKSIHYVIAGPISDPDVARECNRLADQIGVKDRLHFVGPLSAQILRAVVRLARVIAVTGSEPYSIAALEAMAQGRPVVAPRWFSIEEIVRDNVTGLLYQYRDSESATRAVSRLIQDRDLAQKFGESGREIAMKEHTWDQVCRRTLHLYELALDG